MSDADTFEILLENANAYIEDLEVRLVSWRDGCKNMGGRVERLEKALEWFAAEEAWQVTPQSVGDNRFGFNAPPGCVYATPWGFAKGELAAVGGDPE